MPVAPSPPASRSRAARWPGCSIANSAPPTAAWLATYVGGDPAACGYAARMIDTGNFGEIEDLVVRIGAGEYLAQFWAAFPRARARSSPGRSGLERERRWRRGSRPPSITCDGQHRGSRAARRIDAERPTPRSAPAASKTRWIDPRGDAQIRRRQVVPFAQAWHLDNEYIRSISSRRCPSSACSA